MADKISDTPYATLCPKCHLIFDLMDYNDNTCPRCGYKFGTSE